MAIQVVKMHDFTRDVYKWLRPGVLVVTKRGVPAYSVVIEAIKERGDANGKTHTPVAGQEQQSNLNVAQESGDDGRAASTVPDEKE